MVCYSEAAGLASKCWKIQGGEHQALWYFAWNQQARWRCWELVGLFRLSLGNEPKLFEAWDKLWNLSRSIIAAVWENYLKSYVVKSSGTLVMSPWIKKYDVIIRLVTTKKSITFELFIQWVFQLMALTMSVLVIISWSPAISTRREMWYCKADRIYYLLRSRPRRLWSQCWNVICPFVCSQ